MQNSANTRELNLLRVFAKSGLGLPLKSKASGDFKMKSKSTVSRNTVNNDNDSGISSAIQSSSSIINIKKRKDGVGESGTRSGNYSLIDDTNRGGNLRGSDE